MIVRLAQLPRWRRTILRHTPPVLFEYPFELFLSVLCLLSGLPMLLGLATPRSIEALLPWPVVRMWALALIVGSVSTSYGLLRASRVPAFTGLRLLGDASLIYAVAILIVAGWRGLLASMLTLAFATACLARAFHLSSATDWWASAQDHDG